MLISGNLEILNSLGPPRQEAGPIPTPAPSLCRTMLKSGNLEITGGSLGRSQFKLPGTGYVFRVVLPHYPYTFGVKSKLAREPKFEKIL